MSNAGGSDGERPVVLPLLDELSLGVVVVGANWVPGLAWAWRASTAFKLFVMFASSSVKVETFCGPVGWWDCCWVWAGGGGC